MDTKRKRKDYRQTAQIYMLMHTYVLYSRTHMFAHALAPQVALRLLKGRIRSVEVVGASGLLIPNKRNARITAATYKTSAGAVAHLSIAMEADLTRSLDRLKEEGFWIVGVSEHANTTLWNALLSGRIVLVVGSEEEGLAALTAKTCDLLVSLPQKGKIESLNVAQATTVLAYEWMRQCMLQAQC